MALIPTTNMIYCVFQLVLSKLSISGFLLLDECRVLLCSKAVPSTKQCIVAIYSNLKHPTTSNTVNANRPQTLHTHTTPVCPWNNVPANGNAVLKYCPTV